MDAYATHLPVLKLLGAHLPIEAALEFGAGQHSTLEFLNRESFPALSLLVSVERDPAWRKQVEEWTWREKGRHRIERDFWVSQQSTENYDLIFIDDGVIDTERLVTIKAVSRVHPACPVVIHDYEHLPYQQAADFERCWIYTLATPWTAVLWNGSHPQMDELLRGASSDGI